MNKSIEDDFEGERVGTRRSLQQQKGAGRNKPLAKKADFVKTLVLEAT
jgi:hypothetical protein